MLYGWMLGQGDLFIIEYDPLAIILQVTDVVSTTSIFSDVTDQTNQSVFAVTVIQWLGNFLGPVVWGI